MAKFPPYFYWLGARKCPGEDLLSASPPEYFLWSLILPTFCALASPIHGLTSPCSVFWWWIPLTNPVPDVKKYLSSFLSTEGLFGWGPVHHLCSTVHGLFLRALYPSAGTPEQCAENTGNMNYAGVMWSVFKNTTKQKKLEMLSNGL